MICNPSGPVGSAANTVSETARSAIRRAKDVVLRRACARASVEIHRGWRDDTDWLRASGLTPGDARALAHELRAFAQRKRGRPAR
jgi:hypothetical protein